MWMNKSETNRRRSRSAFRPRHASMDELGLPKQKKRVVDVVGLASAWSTVITIRDVKLEAQVVFFVEQEFPGRSCDQSIVGEVLPFREVVAGEFEFLAFGNLTFVVEAKNGLLRPTLVGPAKFSRGAGTAAAGQRRMDSVDFPLQL